MEQNLGELTEKTVAFLRKYEVTSTSPIFEDTSSERVPITSLAFKPPHMFDENNWGVKETDRHRDGFSEIEQLLLEAPWGSIAEVEDKRSPLIIKIKDFDRSDIATHLAKEWPTASYVLVSYGGPKDDAQEPEKGLFREFDEAVEKVYRGQSHANTVFMRDSFTWRKVPNYVDSSRNAIVIHGIELPPRVAFTAAHWYTSLPGVKYVSSIVNVGGVDPKDVVWNIVRQNLKLTPREMRSLAANANNGGGLFKSSPKFNYGVEGQRRIGQAINIAVGCALAMQVNGYVHAEDPKSYNMPGIIVTASNPRSLSKTG